MTPARSAHAEQRGKPSSETITHILPCTEEAQAIGAAVLARMQAKAGRRTDEQAEWHQGKAKREIFKRERTRDQWTDSLF